MKTVKKMNAQDVQRLVTGHRKFEEEIKRMKEETDEVVDLVFGFLNKADISRFKFHQDVCCFESVGLQWRVYKSKTSLSAHVGSGGIVIYIGGMVNNDIPLDYVEPVYLGLPDFLNNMIKVFPFLSDRIYFYIKKAK